MRTLDLFFGIIENRQALTLTALEQKNDFSFFIETTLPPDEFSGILKTLCGQGMENPEKAVEDSFRQNIPYTGKYDYLLPRELLVKQYAANMLDPAAVETLFRP
jgi:hypothetical protein